MAGIFDFLGQAFQRLFQGQPQSTYDPRSGAQSALEAHRVNQAQQLAERYRQALADPSFAMPGPDQQAFAINELKTQGLNRFSGSGGGFSGMNDLAINKSIADFKLNLLQKQMEARQSLGNLAAQYAGMQGYPTERIPPERAGLSDIMARGTGTIAMGGIGKIMEKLYGYDPFKPKAEGASAPTKAAAASLNPYGTTPGMGVGMGPGGTPYFTPYPPNDASLQPLSRTSENV